MVDLSEKTKPYNHIPNMVRIRSSTTLSTQARRFCFTYNNPGDSKLPHEAILPGSESESKLRYLVYQLETGESGTPHWQGYVEVQGNKASPNTLNKLLGLTGAHWEVAGGNADSNTAYCTKVEGRLAGPWTWGEPGRTGRPKKGATEGLVMNRELLLDINEKIKEGWKFEDFVQDDIELVRYKTVITDLVKVHIDLLRKDERAQITSRFEKIANNPRPWQAELMERLKTQNDRQICVIVDKRGNSGKTTWGKVLELYHDWIVLPNAKSQDIAHVMRSVEPGLPGIVIDLARSLRNETEGDRNDFINYQIIESLKDGQIFSGKYSSEKWMITPPKMVLMMNFMPDTSKLSIDRWDILTIDGDRLI